MFKPFILMTVHRRYFELICNIKRYHRLKKEFSVEPEIVIVWADPIKEDDWIFKYLFDGGYIDHLLYRGKLKDEVLNVGFPTAYAESINIRLGLNYIKSIYHNSYCLMQCHDIFVRQEAYGELDHHLQSGYQGVLFDWPNQFGCYSTNFFVLRMDDEKYWPPVSSTVTFDFLERQWWMSLRDLDKTKFKIYNDSNRLFVHSHSYKEQLKFLKDNKIGKTITARAK
jgi:hypothetical protein